jgi:hypothetical protein
MDSFPKLFTFGGKFNVVSELSKVNFLQQHDEINQTAGCVFLERGDL